MTDPIPDIIYRNGEFTTLDRTSTVAGAVAIKDEISFLTCDLTVVGGRVVYAAGLFAPLDDNPLPPAMPDWSPTRTFKGYGAWGDPEGTGRYSLAPLRAQAAAACGCASNGGLHGHDHAGAWGANAHVSDPRSFFGALGCSCWAV